MKQQQHKPNNKKQNLVFTIEKEMELMSFLIEKLPSKSRFNIKSLLKNKQVWIDNQQQTQFNYLLKIGQNLEIKQGAIGNEKQYRGLKIIFEDNDIIVIDKNEGLLSISTLHEKIQTAYSILSSHVKSQDPKNRIFVVHRLDRETSGLMMFAKSEKIQELLQESWNETIMERTYLAVVEGELKKKNGTVISYLKESKALIVYSSQNPAQGQKSITHYEVVKSNKNCTLMKLNLETGRKNQIRVHMKDLGHPILGDKKYGAEYDIIGRLALHAWVLAFEHPITHENLRFETKIPSKFTGLFHR